MREVGLAAGLGFISSSCSFAALAATRALWTKGARLESALAFMFASTNLVIELGVLLWIFLGWQFVLALDLGAGILIPVMVVLVRLTCPKGLAEEARRRATEVQGEAMDPADGLDPSWRTRIRNRRAWSRSAIASSWSGRWRARKSSSASSSPEPFALVGLTPGCDVNLAEQAHFELNHTFFLNLLAAVVAAVQLGLRHWSRKRSQVADHSP